MQSSVALETSNGLCLHNYQKNSKVNEIKQAYVWSTHTNHSYCNKSFSCAHLCIERTPLLTCVRILALTASVNEQDILPQISRESMISRDSFDGW